MSLIDRYIAEVGRHLPEKDRLDIEAEIRSMIHDTIEERGAQAADEKAVVQVLEELGDPRRLAAQYAAPKHYLIGPAWYGFYVAALKRVLYIALPVVAAIAFILSLTENPLDFVDALGDAIGNAFSVGMQITFWMTLVFVLLERSEEVPVNPQKTDQRGWSAAQLPEYAGKRQISVGEAVTDIVMELFALVWIVLPFVQDWLRGDPDRIPFLNPALRSVWLPIFLVLIVLNLIHDVFKLKIGKWTPTLTATNVILCAASIIYIAALAATQQVINPEFLASLGPEQISRLRDASTWSTWTVNITAVIIIGILLWDMVNSIQMAKKLNQQPGMLVHGKNVS